MKLTIQLEDFLVMITIGILTVIIIGKGIETLSEKGSEIKSKGTKTP